MKTLNSYQKLHAAPVLVAAKLLGFRVRGFRGVSTGRAGGKIDAASITTEVGASVDTLTVSTDMDGLYCAWESDGEQHHDRYVVSLSDDGDLRLTAPSKVEPAEPPAEPAWV